MKLLKLISESYKNSSEKLKSEANIRSDSNMKVIASLFMALVSCVLTLMNIFNRYWFMAGTTFTLVVGFGICALLCGVFHKRTATTIIMAALIAFVFSVYAVTGENEGFAILWIILVPAISMSLIGLRAGTILSMYFQLFLVALFYTPLREKVADHYTATFCIRFPVLYLTCFAAAIMLSAQKEFYRYRIEQAAFFDALTGINNRRHYDNVKENIEKNHAYDNITFISIDINRLKFTNDTYGHVAGDALILGSAKCISDAFDKAEAICRIGGDEFSVISYQPKSVIEDQIDKLCKITAEYDCGYFTGISLSIGCACIDDHPGISLFDLEKVADAAMYKSKSSFYTSNGFERRSTR